MLHLHPTAPIRLRPERGADESFVRSVYASTRADELALLDWSEEEKRQFVEMQFRAQSVYYRAQFPGAYFLIIEDGESPIGRLYLDEPEHEIRIIDIALLPEHRRKGIGGSLLEQIQGQAIALVKQCGFMWSDLIRLFDCTNGLGSKSSRIKAFTGSWNGRLQRSAAARGQPAFKTQVINNRR